MRFDRDDPFQTEDTEVSHSLYVVPLWISVLGPSQEKASLMTAEQDTDLILQLRSGGGELL